MKQQLKNVKCPRMHFNLTFQPVMRGHYTQRVIIHTRHLRIYFYIILTEKWTWGPLMSPCRSCKDLWDRFIHLQNIPDCWHISSTQCQTQDVHLILMEMIWAFTTVLQGLFNFLLAGCSEQLWLFYAGHFFLKYSVYKTNQLVSRI